MPVRLSISIVHHDGRVMLRDCLNSIYAYPPGVPFEIVLVDNVSTDGAREMVRTEFPQVRLLENTARAGFGENHNRAMAACRGEYILLLNDDTLVHPGALDALLAFLEGRPDILLVGPRLLNADGTLQKNCFKFPSPLRLVWEHLLLTAAFPDHPVFGDYRAWTHDTVREVDFVTGAAMLVRRSVLTEVGGFDPLFFMYAEETDWQKRMRDKGWRIAFCPDAVITHLGGQSSESMRSRKYCEFYRSQIKFIRKHYGPMGALVQRLASIFGSIVRLSLWSIAYPILPQKRAAARKNITLWSGQLIWWLGFGPQEGIAEMTQKSNRPGASPPSTHVAG